MVTREPFDRNNNVITETLEIGKFLSSSLLSDDAVSKLRTERAAGQVLPPIINLYYWRGVRGGDSGGGFSSI